MLDAIARIRGGRAVKRLKALMGDERQSHARRRAAYVALGAIGTAAALAGGFTAVCCAPNTKPVHDDPSVTEFILGQAEEAGNARVYPLGAVTRGLGGEELAEMAEMRREGAIAFTDDGKPVWNPAILRRAMEYARGLEVPILQHAEDPHLRGAGVMNEGFASTSLGMEGMHPLTEASMVARDILLAELTGARYHVMHVSAALTLREVRRAKEMGLPVTCEATPHHLLLTNPCRLDVEPFRGLFGQHHPIEAPLQRLHLCRFDLA